MSSLKLFNTKSGVTEVMPQLADVEADVHDLIEAHMETMLGVTFLASEYVIDCTDGGRIDSLGLDENGAPVIVEYKRGTDAGVINQGLYYMAWLTSHKHAFQNLVRDRLGATAASQILWSAPRLVCVAGDFTRYDARAVREHRRSIDLVRYRYFGNDHFVLETVASVSGASDQA
ncbi:Transporter [Streptomyces formicae]|uniref:Transporter n=1 Tax=Streptomyces formicae TaxID=1616117 RepID=A0A291QLA4_9ACTN|nr:Transporter [Streptomyces formicae]